MSEDIKKEVREAPCFWPLNPVVTFDEVYHEKICPPEQREFSSLMESWVHPKDEMGKPEALKGVRILDCGLRGYGFITHWATGMLAELGAEVIMVEPPGGSPLRKLTPFGRKKYMFKDVFGGECGLSFFHEARNKQSITLDLDTEEGRDILRKLALQADVLLEMDPPGNFDKMGIGYRQLSKINPKLVYIWAGQRGQWGPYKDKPGMVYPICDSSCGWVHGTGIPESFGGRPVRAGERAGDIVAGNFAMHAVLAALIYRHTSGKGQFVEITGAESHMRILDYNWGWHGFDGAIRPRYGNWDLAINIYSVNPCKDGFMMIGGGHDRLWYRIWKAVGKDRPELEDMILDEPTLRAVVDRVGHEQQVKTCTILADWLKDNTREEARRKLLEEEVAAGGVTFIDEVSEEMHNKYRRHVYTMETMHYGKVLFADTLFKGHKTPGRVKNIGRPVGYDNGDIYQKLMGFGPGKLNELFDKGVI